ncbi:phage tail protein I [Pseudoalteromonas sp. JBTF-M23]|uniref:Phage tail protein I n=1 Tax=Pseudoalteromonas caenipelagi TaxID=2726988 RepID=A0A849VB51_9GAMM|nr:phage tail protein I [Pseudoalteromonas caenipelagi]NOU50000.1 phage tail protein I [Pseudoalteromonas caenipelagi]
MKANNLIPASVQTKALNAISQSASAEFEQLREVASRLNIFDVDSVPAEFLPFLAWQFRVDVWSSNWPTDVKRKVVKTALEVHRTKGTVYAVELALAAVGVTAEIVEWWQAEPQQEPGTFDVVAYTNSNITPNQPSAINVKLIDQLNALIQGVKRKSQHYTITVGLEMSKNISTGVGGFGGNASNVSGSLVPRQPSVSGGVVAAVTGNTNSHLTSSGSLIPRQPKVNGGMTQAVAGLSDNTTNITGSLRPRQPNISGGFKTVLTAHNTACVFISGRLIRHE